MRYILAVLLFFSSTAMAQDATLVWEPSPSEPDGYKIYYQASPYVVEQWDGSGGTEGDSPIDVGNVLTYQVTGLTDDILWWFTVTAYKNAVCSDPQYVDQVTCEAATETWWIEYRESVYSNIVRTDRGGKLFMGGIGRVRLPAPEEPAGKVSF